MCGPSCNTATTSSTTRCADGILYRDTTYTGITHACCVVHDGCYDGCSSANNCGQGTCARTITIRGRTFTIRVPCWLLVEACRRGCDAGCAACALLFGRDPIVDCAAWALGGGPGTPISFIDSVRIGTCCRGCLNRARSPGMSSTTGPEEDCICEGEDAEASNNQLF
jgi:hypothetical protein